LAIHGRGGKMIFGVCGTPEISYPAADAGFDYFEWSVPGLLKPLEAEEEFLLALDQVKKSPLSCPTLNLMVPGHLKITGPEANMGKLESYMTTLCRRADEAGVEVIVFGSGGARQIPEGFSRDQAWDQLVSFCRMVGSIAGEHGVTIAIEPLNHKECNIINSVTEGNALARQTDHPAVKLLVDAYHWAVDGGTTSELLEAGDLLVHVHIATLQNRRAPGIEDYDFQPFFDALTLTGYQDRVSIEGRIDDPQKELPGALTLMKEMIYG